MNGGIPLPEAFLALLPAEFLSFYRRTFQNPRMLYGHWSGGLYTRAVGSHHRLVAILEPLDLDAAIEKFQDARNRRVGGAAQGLWETIEELKRKARIQVFQGAPFDQDLAGHTRGRDRDSVSLALMCGYGLRPNDLRPAEPLPVQLRALVMLIGQACVELHAPVEHFLTASEAADNLDFPTPDDASAPHPPHGFRSTQEVWDLEVWVEPGPLAVHPPVLVPRPGWLRLGDWLRQEALREIRNITREQWRKG